MGAYSKGGFFEGGFNIFLVVVQIPVEIFLLVNCSSVLHIKVIGYFLKDR